MKGTAGNSLAGETLSPDDAGAVTASPLVWLRLEGLTVLILSMLLYYRGGHSWLLFGIAFLVPDLSLVAYLAGARTGAIGYNVAHSYVGPAFMAVLALATGRPPVAALIWTAHIGLDRAVGYGLKYATAFEATHLGRLRGGSLQGVSPSLTSGAGDV